MNDYPESILEHARELAESFHPGDLRKGEGEDTPSSVPDGSTERVITNDRCTPCGMVCSECRFYEENGCAGCRVDITDCDICECCRSKGIRDCSHCDGFPCDILKEAAFDNTSGDGGNRLLLLKSMKEERENAVRLKADPVIIGGCCGVLSGVIIGTFADGYPLWITVCAAVGAAIGLMISLTERDKRSVKK